MWKITSLFAAGIAACLFLPALPALTWGFPVAVLAVCLCSLSIKTRILIWCVLGFLWAWLQAAMILHNTLPRSLEGKTLVMEGRISGLPEVNPRRVRFNIKVTQLKLDGQIIKQPPKKVRLSWYSPGVMMHADERWRLQVRLKRPHGWRNPGGFDYEGWLFRQQINATGYVLKDGMPARLAAAPHFSADSWRQHIAERVHRALSGHPSVNPYSGVVQALLIGERSRVTQQAMDTWVNTGTVHLMAISGLHIGIVFGWFYLLGRWAWAVAGRLPLWIPAQKIGVIGGVAGALLYAMLAGFSIPTQRAFIMVLVGAIFFLSSRKVGLWAPLFAALFGVLLYDPLSILSPGFWLSFWAVAIIFAFLPARRIGAADQSSKRWVQWLWIQLGLLVGLAPILLYVFQKVSLVAPLANLLAVPWVGLVILPLIFVGTLLLLVSQETVDFPLQWAAANIGGLSHFLRGLEHSPVMAVWMPAHPSIWVVVLALLGIALILFQKKWLWKGCGSILFIPLLWNTPQPLPPDAFEIAVLDIGQGLSAVVSTRNHLLVYDTGPYYSSAFNAVNNALLPYLVATGRNRIDRLVIGHADKDHSGGVSLLTGNFSPDSVMGSNRRPFQGLFPAMQDCLAGQSWQWDGVAFDMLAPFKAEGEDNNASCVLRVSSANYSVLIPGDIERATEQQLVRVYGSALHSDALIVPHHGSLTSSTRPFIAAVNPGAAVFSTGYRNRFGFPRKPIVQRYTTQGAEQYDTARDGAVFIYSGDAQTPPQIRRYRMESKRLWNVPVN